MALPYFQLSSLFFFKTLSSSLSIVTADKPTGGEKNHGQPGPRREGCCAAPYQSHYRPTK